MEFTSVDGACLSAGFGTAIIVFYLTQVAFSVFTIFTK